MKAPNFKLSSTSGKIVELNKVKSKYIIIYFYPKDNTSGCTIETNDFNKLLSKFENLGCTIYGISKDSIESHEKFKKKYKVPFELLSDPNVKSQKKYGVWGMKSFMGKKFLGTIRTTIFIDKGKVKKIWSNVRVKDHAKEVFKFVCSNK